MSLNLGFRRRALQGQKSTTTCRGVASLTQVPASILSFSNPSFYHGNEGDLHRLGSPTENSMLGASG